MNIHAPGLDLTPDRDEAQAALDVLRKWANSVTEAEIKDLDPSVFRLVPGGSNEDYPTLSREYPHDFKSDDAYKSGLPDLQNGPASLISHHQETQSLLRTPGS